MRVQEAPSRDASALYNVVTPDYFRTLGARLLRGRDFSTSDAEGAPKVMVINEMLAMKYWGTTNPVGQYVRIQGGDHSCATVIGVVENIRRQSIFEDSTGFVYFPLAQARNFISVRRLVVRPDSGDPARLVDAVRRAMQTAAPQLPFADVHVYQTSSRDPVVFGVVSVILLAVTAVACLLPALRATHVDPAVALRSDS